VASLERYLREVFEEFVLLIALAAKLTSNPKLDRDFAEFNDLNYVSWLVRDSRRQRIDRVAELRRVYTVLANSGFVPESFSRTRANPGPDTVKELFREFGISNAFAAIERNFGRHYRRPFVQGFVEVMLRTIVTRRNEIAHGSSALPGLSIARQDLADWIEFLSGFARAADNTLRDYSLGVISQL
jgi:hypothetical protein